MSEEIVYVSKDGGPPQPCRDLAYALSLGYRVCDPPKAEKTAPVMIVPDEVPRRTRKPRGGNSVPHE